MENVNDLPVEVLSRIFDFLSVSERKRASTVCTLWYDILHYARFQRQCRLLLDSTFEDVVPEEEQIILHNCKNLSITHWDEMYDEDYDDDEDEDEANQQRDKDEIIQFKYLYKPTPEQNIADILFRHELQLESLELNSTFESCREIFEDRLPQIANLKELSLSFDHSRTTNGRTPNTSIWVLKHERLEKLRIEVSYEMKLFQIDAPRLTSLELQPNCRWSMEIIERYSHQLDTLKVRFHNASMIDSLLALAFPRMVHLQVRYYDDKDTQVRYSRTRNRLADMEKDEQFVRKMPRLKTLLLESNLMFFRIGHVLPRYGHQLEDLVLEEQQIDYGQLKVVESLPKLKTFTLFRCEVLMPSTMLPSLNMPHLQELKLYYNESSIVFNEGLAGLKSLRISLWTDKNHKVLYKICKNLPNLEYLKVVVNAKLVNTSFRYLHLLTKLRTLTFDNIEPNALLWAHCPVVTSVRKLVLHNCTLTFATLLPVGRLFPNLRELYLDRCYFKTCDGDSDKEDADEESDTDESSTSSSNKKYSVDDLRKMFPLCRVSFKESFFYPNR